MLKALIKNELFQLNQYYVYNRKTNSMRSKKSLIGLIVLLVFLFLSVTVAFFGMDQLFADAFIGTDIEWAFFSMTGMVALVLGVFGDIFNSYNMLYKSKDNDLLLSMPIEPSKILLAKIVGVAIMGFAYESLAFIPAMVVYWVVAPFSIAGVICPIIIWLSIAVLVVVLTCALGWVVAFISSKIRNKNIIKVMATLGFLALYYIFYFKAMNNLQSVITNNERIAEVISGWLFPFYHMGLAATGRFGSMLIFIGIGVAFFALTYWLMSRSYIKMVTSNKGEKKVAYVKSEQKKKSVVAALIGKELRRFGGTAVYMLNAGLGLVICLVAAVFLFIKAPVIRDFMPMIFSIGEEFPWVVSAIPVVAALVPAFLYSMNAISAPSVSLEGKSLWILQSSPVDPAKVLFAKVLTHILLCSFSTLVLSIAVAYALDLSALDAVLAVVFGYVFMVFTGVTGVLLDFIKGNLNWTNEVYPIKQGFSFTVIFLGGWGLMIILAGLFYLLRNTISGTLYIGLLNAIFIALNIIFANKVKKLAPGLTYLS